MRVFQEDKLLTINSICEVFRSLIAAQFAPLWGPRKKLAYRVNYTAFEDKKPRKRPSSVQISVFEDVRKDEFC